MPQKWNFLGNDSNILVHLKNDFSYLKFHLGTPFENQVIVHTANLVNIIIIIIIIIIILLPL